MTVFPKSHHTCPGLSPAVVLASLEDGAELVLGMVALSEFVRPLLLRLLTFSTE